MEIRAWPGKRWYPRLIRDTPHSLRSVEGKAFHHNDGRLIVHYNDGKRRWYTSFANYLEFWLGLHKYGLTEYEFSEVILGDYHQKPRIDIDMSSSDHDHRDVLTHTISALILVMRELKVELNLSTDVALYSSHGSTKKSYHIILHRWCVPTHKHADWILRKVRELLPPQYQEYIDTGVAKAVQSFRMLHCSKASADGTEIRTKLFVPCWEYKGETIVSTIGDESGYNVWKIGIEEFEASLITYVADCEILSIPDLKEEKRIYEDQDINWDALEAWFSKTEFSGYFHLDETDAKGIVRLQRFASSHCPICARVHDREHAFLVVRSDGNVSYGCHRTNAKPIFLGNYLHSQSITLPPVSSPSSAPDLPSKDMISGLNQYLPRAPSSRVREIRLPPRYGE
jgi:hypothetical protein